MVKPLRLINLSQIWKQAVDLEVDGEKFPGPCGYHEALTMLYGDYMTPPPPGDRELVHCDPKFVTLSYSEKGEKNS